MNSITGIPVIFLISIGFAIAASAGDGEDGEVAYSEKLDELVHSELGYAAARRKAAELGDAEAQFVLALWYGEGIGVPQDYAQAVKWSRKAAEQGQVDAQVYLGAMYNYGRGVSQDYAQAVSWYRKAAEQGEAVAQTNLANMYLKGEGVPKDYAQAVDLYRMAAEQGYDVAQHNLGYFYNSGKVVPQDDTQAVYWYRKAAEQGNAKAQFKLGEMLYEGLGIEKNIQLAIDWTEKAAAGGDQEAANNLKIYLKEFEAVAKTRKALGIDSAEKRIGKTVFSGEPMTLLDVIKAIRNKTASPNTLFALDDPDGYVIAQQISEGFLFQTTEVDRRKFYLPIILKTTNAGFEGDGMRDVATYVLYTGVEVYPSVLGSGKQAFVFVDKGK